MAETTLYYRLPSGAFAQRTVDGDELTVALPDGAVEVTAAEYETGVAAIREANAAATAEQQAAARQAQQADYDALLAAGIPETTARRLSGYTPDPAPETGGGDE